MLLTANADPNFIYKYKSTAAAAAFKPMVMKKIMHKCTCSTLINTITRSDTSQSVFLLISDELDEQNYIPTKCDIAYMIDSINNKLMHCGIVHESDGMEVWAVRLKWMISMLLKAIPLSSINSILVLDHVFEYCNNMISDRHENENAISYTSNMMGVMVAYGVDISCALKYNSLKSIINNSFKLGKFESCVIYGIITQDLVRDHVPLRVPIRKLVEYLDSIGNERFKNSAIKHLLSMITMTFDTHRIKFYHKNIRDMLFLIMCIRYRLTKQRQALPENKIVYNFDILPCD